MNIPRELEQSLTASQLPTATKRTTKSSNLDEPGSADAAAGTARANDKKKARPKSSVWKLATLSDNTPDFIVTFLEWFFRKEADEEDVAGQWWVLRNEAAHVPLVMGLFTATMFLLLYYAGLFSFMFRRGYVQEEVAFVEGACGSCANAVSVFEYPDEEARAWMRNVDKLFVLKAADGERGWFTLPAHWAYDSPRNVSLSMLRPIMMRESEGGACDCGTDHGIPASIFAYNGVAYMAHHISGARGAAVKCKVGVASDDGVRQIDVSAPAAAVVRYWDGECEEKRQDAAHALLCCASLCQMPPKNLLL